MQALVFDKQLRFETNYPDPQPAADECLVQVRLAGICATDLQILHGYMDFTGVPGHEMVGTVVSGPRLRRNKRVVCEINCVCRRCDMCLSGLSSHCRNRTVMGIAGRDGCFAELIAVPERNLHDIPDSISDEEAVFVEPLAAAYQVIQQCPIERRMNVAVVGSGRLGLLVAQVLAASGCRLQVIGRNPKTLLLCEKKGIMAKPVDELVPRADRDVVVECSGSAEGLEIALQLVRPRGTIVLKSTYAQQATLNLAPAVVSEVTILGSRCGPFPEAIGALARKQIDVSPMISRTFRLERGIEALGAAADPGNIKVLLKIAPPAGR
ncbi:MAG TPA: alcohol dehydrogenase catalytic domain-containing protein [Phycisphaerae bacterium]|nr:alcohol dehydrogenase catalytic domain-containing protein [Phycisphaerae bacterium]